MNPLVFLVVPVVGILIWILVVALRTGQYLIKSGRTTQLIRRHDNPSIFWVLAAFNLGLVLYLVHTATQLE